MWGWYLGVVWILVTPKSHQVTMCHWWRWGYKLPVFKKHPRRLFSHLQGAGTRTLVLTNKTKGPTSVSLIPGGCGADLESYSCALPETRVHRCCSQAKSLFHWPLLAVGHTYVKHRLLWPYSLSWGITLGVCVQCHAHVASGHRTHNRISLTVSTHHSSPNPPVQWHCYQNSWQVLLGALPY
jgi:hypothetical protein